MKNYIISAICGTLTHKNNVLTPQFSDHKLIKNNLTTPQFAKYKPEKYFDPTIFKF